MENMTELERKFIMMSRIAVILRKSNLVSSVTLHGDFAVMDVLDEMDSYEHVSSIYDREITEQELLDWWRAIEG